VQRKLRVAVFGDGMTDRYWLGTADRLSPEFPGPVVRINDVMLSPGGAGNVAANLETLGCEVVQAFNIGPVKNRLMVGDHQIARWDQKDSVAPYCYDIPYVPDAIVVADYGKGGVDKGTLEYVKKFACPIFVDTKRDPSCWSGVATAIFPNEKERREFHQQYHNFKGIVVSKCGDKGLCYQDYPGHWSDISPAQARFVRSVNGAGDTVMAAFVYRYLVEKYNIESPYFWQECLDFANAAAAIAVEHPYTYAPTLVEVEERYYRGTESN